MMVVFVSESEKGAIKTTERVLDAFALRIGKSTWRTVITQDGLKMVKVLLGKTATKNTAVSCHWIRSRSVSQLLWIVGNKNKFDILDGIVPVNYTEKSILSNYESVGWDYMPMLQSLVAVSALFHDLGKSSLYFQNKLKCCSNTTDPFRHELVSAMLLWGIYGFFCDKGKDWLKELSVGNVPCYKDIINYCRTYNEWDDRFRPFKVSKGSTDSLLLCVLWLILSHHRLPSPVTNEGKKYSEGDIPDNFLNDLYGLFSIITVGNAYKRQSSCKNDIEELDQCFNFPEWIDDFSVVWFNHLKKWSSRLADSRLLFAHYSGHDLRAVLKYARLSLMLGDHNYSSKDNDLSWRSKSNLFANTFKTTRELKQKLDEHLCGVCDTAVKIAYFLPYLESNMPYAENVKELTRRVSLPRFIWQNQAVDKLKKFNRENENQDIKGGFILNMASTGCGKTIANAKIALGIGKNDKLRFTLALGLRTLTLQTGDEYRNKLGMSDEEVAVIVGSSAIKYLHQHDRPNEDEMDFSDSSSSLFDEYVDFNGILQHDLFSTITGDEKQLQLLCAPVLVCTIDQLMPATECVKGGKYIPPFMRLMTSNLVIDEVDDFSTNDLFAVGRLVYLAGTFGKKVILSSATIPYEVVVAFFNAYYKGLMVYEKLNKCSRKIMCMWVDEFNTQMEIFEKDKTPKFSEMHKIFINKRIKNLTDNKSFFRMGQVFKSPFDDIDEGDLSKAYFKYILDASLELHDFNHVEDPETYKEVSFGVIRMANIDPCVKVAKYLCEAELPLDTEIRVMVYHSRQVLLMRHYQEKYLDTLLKRKNENVKKPKILEDVFVRKIINKSKASKILFVVVATPVAEVGRDHDYDWAVIEPSSWRSIIQMSGRVNRHRNIPITNPNVSIMQFNYKAFINKDAKNECYFIKPGYEEDSDKPWEKHDLSEYLHGLSNNNKFGITAVDRITTDYKNNKNKLSSQELIALGNKIKNNTKIYGFLGYGNSYADLTSIPQTLNKFRQSNPVYTIVYRFEDKNFDEAHFFEKDSQNNWNNFSKTYTIKNIRDYKYTDRLWLNRNYKSCVEEYSEQFDKSFDDVADYFGEVHLPIYKNNWIYSDNFGVYSQEDEFKED